MEAKLRNIIRDRNLRVGRDTITACLPAYLHLAADDETQLTATTSIGARLRKSIACHGKLNGFCKIERLTINLGQSNKLSIFDVFSSFPILCLYCVCVCALSRCFDLNVRRKTHFFSTQMRLGCVSPSIPNIHIVFA